MNSQLSDHIPADVAPPPPRHEGIFIGPYGLRAGWKVLIFLSFYELLSELAAPLSHLILGAHFDSSAMQPIPMFWGELLRALTALVPTAILAKVIDGKLWGYFGMPLSRAFQAKFWVGGVVGIAALATQLEIMHLAGWFDFGTAHLHGLAILKYGVVWFAMFTCTGFFEEGLFRGYSQRVLTDGMGFWPAAVLTSLIFGLVHLANPGETAFGILMIAVDGMVMCFSLWRTGDLWFAIGNHAAWDWGMTFLFGTPNSGLHGAGALMHPTFHGPALLAGGSDGPEGSILVLLSEALIAISVALLYRKRKYPLLQDESHSADSVFINQ
jgi:membrane protease YdiL (CAAX protease family)